MAASIEEQVLEAQGFGYAVCAVQSNALAIDDSLYGECGCEHDCRAMFYQWGVEIMNTTKAEDCDCNDKCVDADFACRVIKLLNPGCIECGCGSADDVPIDCTVTQDITVYRGADAGLETILLPAIGVYFLITTNLNGVVGGWADHLGEIAVSDGATWTYTVPAPGTLIYDAFFQVYYIAYAGGVGEQYPIIQGTQVLQVVTLASNSPLVNAAAGRDILVQGSVDGGTTWTVGLYVGPESALGSTVDVTIVGTINATRTYYYTNDYFCQYGPFIGAVPPVSSQRCFSLGNDSVTGKEAGIVSFDPANGVTDIFTQDKFTLATWVKFVGPNPFAFIFQSTTSSFQNQAYLYHVPGSMVFSGTGAPMIVAGIDLFDSQWHHVAVVRDGVDPLVWTAGTMTLYIDGVAFAMPDGGVSVLQPGKNFLWAGYSEPAPATFDSELRMAEVYFCNTARSQSDIQNFMMTGLIEGNDATWVRTLYMQPRITDVVGGAGVDTQNGTGSNYTMQPGVTFVNDSPLP